MRINCCLTHGQKALAARWYYPDSFLQPSVVSHWVASILSLDEHLLDPSHGHLLCDQ